MRLPPSEHIRAALESGPVFVNGLVWEASMAEEGGPLTVSPFETPTLQPEQSVPRSHYESIRRSVREFIQRGEVRETSRRPTARELLDLYPYQTKSSQVAFLRKKLLPALFRGAAEDHDDDYEPRFDGGRYTRAQNELFALARLSTEDGQHLQSRWLEIADRMLQIEAALPPEQRHAVFAVRVKCAELFGSSEVTHGQTFQRLLRRLEKCLLTPLIAEAIALMRSIHDLLPLAEISQARLKTALYGYVDFRERRTVGLSQHAKDMLRRAAPHIVENLPGFRENTKKKTFFANRDAGFTLGFEAFTLRQEPNAFYDPLLDKLVGRDLFRRFQFIEYAA